MRRKWLSIVILVAVAGLLFGVNSCGRFRGDIVIRSAGHRLHDCERSLLYQ